MAPSKKWRMSVIMESMRYLSSQEKTENDRAGWRVHQNTHWVISLVILLLVDSENSLKNPCCYVNCAFAESTLWRRTLSSQITMTTISVAQIISITTVIWKSELRACVGDWTCKLFALGKKCQTEALRELRHQTVHKVCQTKNAVTTERASYYGYMKTHSP